MRYSIGHRTGWAVLFVILATVTLKGGAARTATGDAIDFESRVFPLLATKCGSCHGPHEAESGFRIDLREKAFEGGDLGTVGIVAGKPDESEILVRITTSDKESLMPADGEPLTADEQKLVKEWIAAGAVWPDDLATLPESMLPKGQGKAAKGADHWAFPPVVRPSVPDGEATWGKTEGFWTKPRENQRFYSHILLKILVLVDGADEPVGAD